MEFGLHEALPLYAGGLGVLAGDYLKTASDLDIPVIGVGILWQQGYFRQVLDAAGWQTELYPFNEPASLPIQRVVSAGMATQRNPWSTRYGIWKSHIRESSQALATNTIGGPVPQSL